jgi:hypothetical protein
MFTKIKIIPHFVQCSGASVEEEVSDDQESSEIDHI